MNLLVTSINAKIPLLACVRDAMQRFDMSMRLFGSDCDASVLGRYFVDEFWQMPHLEKLTCKEVITYCHTHKIGYIIPTRDHDVLFFAKHQETLKEANIACFVGELTAVRSCYDKLVFAQNGASFHTIPTCTRIDELTCRRFVVKERFGSGSKNVLLNGSKAEALTRAKTLKEPIFQPFIEGNEYSVDTYVDQKGICVGSIVRAREKVVGGESKVTTYAPNEALAKSVEALVVKLGLKNHAITQAIVNEQGIFIIECNARFGGASSLSYKMGLESFLWFLQETAHQPLTFTLHTDVTRLVRVEQDVFFAH